MSQNQVLIEKLCTAMEEEIFLYHLLGEELKKESESLRKGSTDSLIDSLRSLEVHIGEIRKTREVVQRTLEKILVAEGRAGDEGLSALVTILAPPDYQRLKDCHWTLERLKKGIAQMNHRNKMFVQESLNCWKSLFSLLTDPLKDAPVYIQNGKTQASARVPLSLNREV